MGHRLDNVSRDGVLSVHGQHYSLHHLSYAHPLTMRMPSLLSISHHLSCLYPLRIHVLSKFRALSPFKENCFALFDLYLTLAYFHPQCLQMHFYYYFPCPLHFGLGPILAHSHIVNMHQNHHDGNS